MSIDSGTENIRYETPCYTVWRLIAVVSMITSEREVRVMNRRATFAALGAGTLIACLFVAVGMLQASFVAWHQLTLFVLQLTWIELIPAGLFVVWFGHRLAARGQPISAIIPASALAGFLGGAGCVMANIFLQVARREHPLESYPGLMPAFVAVSLVSVLAAGPLLGAALGLGGSLPGAARAKLLRAASPIA
jgi:hypothetical protein